MSEMTPNRPDKDRLPPPEKRAVTRGPTPMEYLIGAVLAGASGAAVAAHALGWAHMRHTAVFLVLPATIIVLSATLLGLGKKARYRQFAQRVMVGALWGLIATLFYDAIRPPVGWLLGSEFNPYGAMPAFGSLISGYPKDHPIALTVGWTYHFWNGVSFGIMYALVRPGGGWFSGFIWGAGLQLMMMALYPSLLQIRLDNPGFLWTGIVGHSAWGLVLGYGIARWGNLKRPPTS